MLVAIALANKMARTMWAMLARNEDYRVPASGRSSITLCCSCLRPDKRECEKATTRMGKTIEQIWIRKTSSGLRALQLANEIWI